MLTKIIGTCKCWMRGHTRYMTQSKLSLQKMTSLRANGMQDIEKKTIYGLATQVELNQTILMPRQ